MTTTFTFADGFLNLEHCRKMEAGGGESGDESGTWRRMDSLNLEVSVTARDLKLLLGRLGDLEDPYFKCLEVILLSLTMLSSVTCTSPPQDECEAQRDGDQEMDGGSEVEDDVKKMILPYLDKDEAKDKDKDNFTIFRHICISGVVCQPGCDGLL